MLIVLDNVLPRDVCDAFAEGHYNNTIPHFVPFTLLKDLDPVSKELYVIAAHYFNLYNVLGMERWSNVDQVTPAWHTDHDMNHFMRTQEEKYPRCTIVYYPFVDDNLSGGKFKTETEVIIPKTNRMILFGPGILHHVQPFTGKRVSVVYNPWDYNPHE